MISETHLLDAGVLPTITEPLSAVTNCASPLFAEAITKAKTQNLVPEVTKKLEAFAQHRSQKPQEVPESREEGNSQIPCWGGRLRNNFPVEDRHIKRAARQKAECRRTRNASITTINETTGSPTTSFTPMSIDIENNLPPEDSLLFSPNPITMFNSKENFEPSPYQGPPPPPGAWGNMPWGTNWDDAAK